MTEQQQQSRQPPVIYVPVGNSAMPYVWSTLALFLIGVILIGIVIYLRPTLDPLIVIGSVFGFVISVSTGVGAFIKSQEMHMQVNSWKAEDISAKEMVVEVAAEQTRVTAEQSRVSDAVAAVEQHVAETGKTP